MAHLSLSLLGPFDATLNGVSISFATDKLRALLAYLAVESDRAHPRAVLAEVLWPERSGSSSLSNLRGALAQLRHALGDDLSLSQPFLLVSRSALRFNPASDHWLDVAEFGSLSDSAAGTAELERAISLYRADFLEGFSLRDSPEFDRWANLVREERRERMLGALERRAIQEEERGELDEALRFARRQIDVAPWKEDAHRRVMRLLAVKGERGAALAQFETCRQAMQDELGVEPSAETVTMWEQIRNGELSPRTEPRMLNLPVSLFPLVGRDEEMEEITRWLGDPGCRLLTLLGPGGAGKTRLAAEAGRAVAHRFEHGLCFVPLSATQPGDGMVPAIAQGLGFASYRGAGMSPKEQLLGYLREKRLLLVLDSCEHLLEEAPLVAEILGAAPGVIVLATTPVRLNLPGEQLFPVEDLEHAARTVGLPSPSNSGMECRQGEGWGEGLSPAAELFVEAARRVRPGYAVGEGDTPAVAAICQRVEGMPLAILLAASWMHVLEPTEIAAELAEDSGHGIDFLAAEWQGVPERERSMRATLDRSWSLLTEREQAILAGLSVFRGGFTAEGAEAVTGASLRDLARLVDRSLAYRRESGRYDLHDLLREYAATKLAESPDAEEGVRDRHANYYMHALANWAELWGFSDEVIADVEAEWENLRVVWARGVQKGRWTWLAEAAKPLLRFGATYAGLSEKLVELLGLAEEKWRAIREEELSGSAPMLHAVGTIIGLRAYLGAVFGHDVEAIAPMRESLALLEAAARAGADTRKDLPVYLRRLGSTLERSDPDEAKRWYARDIALARETSNQQVLAGSLTWSGRLALRKGSIAEARQQLAEANDIWRVVGNAPNHIRCLSGLTQCALLGRDPCLATRWAEEAQAVAQRLGAVRPGPFTKHTLARLLHNAGRFEEAEALYQEEVAFYRRQALPRSLAQGMAFLGQNEWSGGRYREASAHLLGSMQLYREIGDGRGARWCYLGLGMVSLGECDLAESERWLECWLRESPELDHGTHECCFLSAPVTTLARRWNEASQYLREMLRYRWVVETLPALSLYCAARGDAERAAELYALASTHPFVANSKWYEDVCGQRIAAAAAHLPEEVIRAAEERGRERNWKATIAELLAELEEEQATSDPAG